MFSLEYLQHTADPVHVFSQGTVSYVYIYWVNCQGDVLDDEDRAQNKLHIS